MQRFTSSAGSWEASGHHEWLDGWVDVGSVTDYKSFLPLLL